MTTIAKKKTKAPEYDARSAKKLTKAQLLSDRAEMFQRFFSTRDLLRAAEQERLALAQKQRELDEQEFRAEKAALRKQHVETLEKERARHQRELGELRTVIDMLLDRIAPPSRRSPWSDVANPVYMAYVASAAKRHAAALSATDPHGDEPIARPEVR